MVQRAHSELPRARSQTHVLDLVGRDLVALLLMDHTVLVADLEAHLRDTALCVPCDGLD